MSAGWFGDGSETVRKVQPEGLDLDQVLRNIESRGVFLYDDRGQLRVQAPRGVLSNEGRQILLRYAQWICALKASTLPARRRGAGRTEGFPQPETRILERPDGRPAAVSPAREVATSVPRGWLEALRFRLGIEVDSLADGPMLVHSHGPLPDSVRLCLLSNFQAVTAAQEQRKAQCTPTQEATRVA